MPTVQKRSASFTRRVQNEFSRPGGSLPAPVNASVEEKVFGFFQPDVLLPDQYLATTRSKTYRKPEKRLMLAVLEDAVWCFQSGLLANNKRKRGLFSEAEEWIMEEDGDWLFSFDHICELLGLNPKYIRKQLVGCKEAALSSRVQAKAYRLTQSGERNGKTAGAAGARKRRFLKAAGF